MYKVELSISKKYGVLAMLDNAVSEGVWSEVQGILKNWGSRQIASPLPQTKASRLKEALFSLDTDKAIYLQVVAEDLQEFTAEPEQLNPLNDQLASEMKARTEAIVGDLSSSAASSPVRVLVLMVYQQVSGATYIGLGAPVKPESTEGDVGMVVRQGTSGKGKRRSRLDPNGLGGVRGAVAAKRGC